MSIALAVAWRINQTGTSRFKRLLPVISDLYCGVSIVVPPDSVDHHIAEIEAIPNVKLLVAQPGANRRFLTLRQALTFEQAAHIHYCDGDHVVSRMELHLPDWKQTLKAVPNADCLIVMRSQAVFDRYPRPLRETEQIINMVGSHLLGWTVDLGSGSRGFSRGAVEFLMRYASDRTHGVATDLEWAMLLQRAGFHIKTQVSEGAVYEITSEYQWQQLESVEQWAVRTQLARLIIEAGILAATRNDLPEYRQQL